MAFRQILCCAVRLTVQTAGNAMFFRLRPEALSIRPEAHMSLSFQAIWRFRVIIYSQQHILLGSLKKRGLDQSCYGRPTTE